MQRCKSRDAFSIPDWIKKKQISMSENTLSTKYPYLYWAPICTEKKAFSEATLFDQPFSQSKAVVSQSLLLQELFQGNLHRNKNRS